MSDHAAPAYSAIGRKYMAIVISSWVSRTQLLAPWEKMVSGSEIRLVEPMPGRGRQTMQAITTWITRLAKALQSMRQKTSAQSPINQSPTRNFAHERETERADQMSGADQTWEADRRQRDQTARAATPPSRPVAAASAHGLLEATAGDSREAERRQEDNWESEGGALVQGPHREPNVERTR